MPDQVASYQRRLRRPPWYISPTMSFSKRRKTVTVDVGGIKVGSERPIVVQSMTNTDTAAAARRPF